MFESGCYQGFRLSLLLLRFLTLQVLAEVIVPPHLQAIEGKPVMISCNISIGEGQSLSQVRWLDGQDQTILSYLADETNLVSKSTRLELVDSTSRTSVIRIKKAGLKDEGCYRCIFDVYPTGQQEGRTCLSVYVKLDLEGNKTVISGNHATLKCRYGLGESVQQVLWTKTAEQGDTTTVASYATQEQPIVEQPFQGHVKLSRSLENTQLSLQPVRLEDEGCYTCEFHTYPHGTRSATACLIVHVLPKPEMTRQVVSPGVTELNCTAVSRPASQILWNVEGDNHTLGPSMSSFFEQGDGTTLVTSTILVQDQLISEKDIKCIVHHKGLTSPISIQLAKIFRLHIITFVIVAVVAVLLFCLCIQVTRCFTCCMLPSLGFP